MPHIQGQDRYQITLFPESIDQYISDGNPVRVIDEYVEGLDLEVLGFTRTVCNSAGRPPYHPKDLLKLYLYGYLNRIRTSRRLETEASRNIEVIWLMNKLKPDFKTIADFRKDNKKALKNVFREFNRLADGWGLFGKELVAIDGTKFRADNSKKNNFTEKKIDRHLKYINEKIELYMKELDEGDRAEACEIAPSTEEVKKRIQKLHNRKGKYTEMVNQLAQEESRELSTTDPDARQMYNRNGGVEIGYNVQTTVDAEHSLIMDFKVTQNPNDLGELDNMALRAKKLFGGKDFEALADKGYYKADDLKKCVKHGIQPYVSKQSFSNGTGNEDYYPNKFIYDKDKKTYTCPQGIELTYYRERKAKGKVIGYGYRNYKACEKCQFKDLCTKSKKGRDIFRHVDQDFLDTIDQQFEQNIKTYKLRQMIVEHPFGTIKRNWGAYYFLTRGKASVTTEISLSYLMYNMKRVISILGVEEILRRLRERRKPATA